jgi:protein-L-isoaspartate(D-aspartate) O-methyltransferase
MKNPDRMLKDIENEVALTRQYTGIESLEPRVIQVMEQVPRHEFMPEDLRYLAYENGPTRIG